MPKSKTHNTDTASTTDDLTALQAELAELRSSKAATEAELGRERAALREARLSTMSATERALVSEQEATDAKIASLEGEADSIENQIATLADEPGNGAAIAKLTRQLTSVSTNLDRETGKKTFLAAEREKVTATNKTAREATPATGEKVLANGAKLSSFSPKTQTWLEAHPLAFTDVRFMKNAIRAAQDAIEDEGIKDDSPEYFQFVEERLGLNKAPDANEDEQDEDEGEDIATADNPRSQPADTRESYAPERPQRAAAGPGAMSGAAPPSRQTPQGVDRGGNRRMPTLTAAEREVALSLYPNEKSDADRLVKYAQGKKFMKERNAGYFRGNN